LFNAVCRKHGLSSVRANRQLLEDYLDSEYLASEAINSGAVRLAPATPQELEQYQQEAVELHNDRLLRTSKQDLRRIARASVEQKIQFEKQQEADRVLDVKRQFQAGRFETLPSHWKGEVLDANFIKRASQHHRR
jgi:hypothetical protein